MGQRLVSLKGDLPFWRGKSRLSVNDRGQRRFLKLENCYVSSDGGEIRQFPGYATILDLTAINNADGYERLVPDGHMPILDEQTPNAPYRYAFDANPSLTGFLNCKAKPSHIFAFEQIGDEIIVIGESRFRQAPIYDASRNTLTVTNVDTTSGNFVITLSGTIAASTTINVAGPGHNGLAAESIVYFEDVTVSDPAQQAVINSVLNGRFHELVGITTTTTITLTTTTGTSFNSASTGSIFKIRPNRSNTYSTSGTLPYTSTYNDRPDDPDALTVWRVKRKPNLASDINVPCWPAWVANRQRDCGDVNYADSEGILFTPTEIFRGVSRREQRRLPYRPTVECALDRILLAAPQYGCMFQIPLIVPIDPSPWPVDSTSDIGIIFANNSIYDKPRALGIPKPRLIENIYTPAPTSPNDDGNVSVSVSARTGSPNWGLDAGTYRFAISFEDVGTGDEGLASEPITVTIPAPGTYAYTISINYLHPGYFMPECLATKLNVYIATSADGPLAFYGSFQMETQPRLFNQQWDCSAVNGFYPTTPFDQRALWRRFDLPLLSDSGDISTVLDATRLAPQSATMPRGATACRYIRGVLFAGGALGNAGPSLQLWRAKATSFFQGGNEYYREDDLQIHAHALSDAAIPPVLGGTLDGDTSNGTLGIGGRAFPDAYQGIEVVTEELFPGGDSLKTVDKVLNRRVVDRADLSSPGLGFRYAHAEFVRMQRASYDRQRIPGASPNTATTGKASEDIHYVMPRGQIQVGDPGEPQRSSRAFIKLIDPNKGDDITAIGQIAGSAIICTRKETYSYSWYRNPGGETPNTMSNTFGCVAPNSMVEFDGGLAWMSEHGPVAIGGGLQHIGEEIAEDFEGEDRVYASDSLGMMYHCWGYHDASRHLIMWGLLRNDSTVVIEDEGVSVNQASATDKQLSRFPCNEVLIWSYKTGAFSTWRPPAGLEVLWMRTIKDVRGYPRACFLAADKRIYALDDTWGDSNGVYASPIVSIAADGSGTTFTFTNAAGTFQDGDGSGARNTSLMLREGMLVEFLDEHGDVVSDTTIASITTTGASGGTVELAASKSWKQAWTARIGGRQRATILSNYIGAEMMDTTSVDGVQVRYTLNGNLGIANARVKLIHSDWDGGRGEQSRTVALTKEDRFEELGWTSTGDNALDQLGRRRSYQKGRVDAQEIAVQIELTGEQQVRIQDIALEVS